MRGVNGLLLLALLGLQYALWFGDKNAFDLYRLSNTIDELEARNDAAVERNISLRAEVVDLKRKGETIETLIRSELGLIKKNETFYQIIE